MVNEWDAPRSSGDWEVLVDIGEQCVHLLTNGRPVKSWPASTSKFGIGFEVGSNKTPTGHFLVAEKIGAEAPLWTEFKSRQPTGRIAEPGGEQDGILSRILWLEGTDEENANTKDRYIYFHGTNREDLIGTPASHGCVRLRNADIAELFDLIPIGTRVRIA
ncbi:L,D-transpeptidase [bacterium]|nr:L,D-transpeptidase [bacterium]NBS51565.1 L,D-transpeptidase [Spartobacteria bacterium]